MINGKIKKLRMLKWLVLVSMIIALIPAYPSQGLAYSHAGGMYTQAQIDFVKSKVQAGEQPWTSGYNKLMTDANAWAGEVPSAVAIWSVPGYYQDGAGHLAARDILMNDVKAAYASALAYAFTGTSAYADKTRAILVNWSGTNTSITGDDGALAGAYVGTGLIMAAELINGYSGWTTTDKSSFRTWLQNVYLRDVNISGPSNRGIWSCYARMLAYHYLDDNAGFTASVTKLKNLIDTAIDVDGFMPEETARGTNGMWYTYFALAPLTAASQLVYNVTGENLFNGKVSTALSTYFTYVQHPEQWPYTANQAFPASFSSTSWPLNLYEAMGGMYSRQDYTNFVQAYRPLNAPYNQGNYHHFAWFYPTLFYNVLSIGDPGNPLPAAEVIVDNAATDSSMSITGAWVSSTALNNFYGSNFLHDGNEGKGTKEVRFTPQLPSAGTYAVYMRWTPYSNRASNTPVTVYHAGGSASLTINMKSGGTWYLLGTYTFNAGQSAANGSVKIATTGTNGYVVADAVRFVKP